MAEHYGFLQVLVRTARDALPIEAAEVLVESPTLSRGLLTDRSGRTEALPLPAPSASGSLSADGRDPFALYRVTVKKEGFYPHVTENVPVFAGITSLQPVTLIGRAAYGSDTLIPESSVDTVGSDPQVLNQGG